MGGCCAGASLPIPCCQGMTGAVTDVRERPASVQLAVNIGVLPLPPLAAEATGVAIPVMDFL